jgi:hypothetical protein
MVLNTPGFLRYYDETIDLLLERGHEVLLGFTDAQIRADALANLDERPRRPTVHAANFKSRRRRWASWSSS